MTFLEWIRQPWPWYVAGPLIGLMVPLLLLAGNKTFGVSSSLRHICAACIPAGISFFKYDWKKEIWNLLFVAGITAGAFIAVTWLSNDVPILVNPKLSNEMKQYRISNYDGQIPADIFNWHTLLSAKGLILIVAGGFLVGFGTRWAGGCTSGHTIMGLSNLQLPSLIATISFMAGGFMSANLLLPWILKW
jgi:uncharacterized membrane protein YedE/YeeE